MPKASPESKTKFLDAAMQVIRAKGYVAARVEDVCEVAGLSKGSFFHHFKTKEELAIAAAEHFSEMAAGRFAAAPYQEETDPRARLLGYVDFRIAILQGPIPGFTCLLGTMVQETYETQPTLLSACERHLSAHAADLVPDVVAAKAQYAPAAPWTPEAFADYIVATIQGAFIFAKARQGPETAAQTLRLLQRHLELEFPLSRSR